MQARPVSFATQQSRKRKGVNSLPSGVKQAKLDSHKACKTGSYDNVKHVQCSHSIVPVHRDQQVMQLQQSISSALNEQPERILSHLVSLANLHDVSTYITSMMSPLEYLMNELNLLQIPFANVHSNNRQDTCASSRCHPLLLETFKPVQTTGDGNCLYNALSLTLTGTEQFTHLDSCVYML